LVLKKKISNLCEIGKTIIVALNISLYFTIGMIIKTINFLLIFLIKKKINVYGKLFFFLITYYILNLLLSQILKFNDKKITLFVSLIPCIYSFIFIYKKEQQLKKMNRNLERFKKINKI